jgi:hypothetical protein
MLDPNVLITLIESVLSHFVFPVLNQESEPITWKYVREWFQIRNEIRSSNDNIIAFTLLSKTEEGKYKLIIGLFNTQIAEIVEGEQHISLKLDDKLLQVHSDNEFVIYK